MWQWIVIWWLHDSHMLVTRQSHVDHTTVTCWSHDSHMLVTRQSHVGHMTVHAKMFMSLLCADQQYVTEYRLDVLGGPEGDTLHCFGIKYMGTHPTFASNATFPDKVWVCTCVCGVVGVGVCGWVCVCVCAYTSTGVGAVSSWFCVLKRRKTASQSDWCERWWHDWYASTHLYAQNNISFVAQGRSQLKDLLRFTTVIRGCVYRFQVCSPDLQSTSLCIYSSTAYKCWTTHHAVTTSYPSTIIMAMVNLLAVMLS